MPDYVYIDTRLLWLLMFLASGAMQYILIGAVRTVMHWTRKREPEPRRSSAIVSLEDYRRQESR